MEQAVDKLGLGGDASAGLEGDAKNCDAGDSRIIRYDPPTSSLFSFHIFSYGSPTVVNASTSLQTFLKRVAEFKDVSSKDYVLLAVSGTNLKDTRFGEIWMFERGSMSEVKKWDESMQAQVNELDAQSRKYYFDIVDKHTTHDSVKHVYSVDDDAIEAELRDIRLDRELQRAASAN